MGDVAEGKRGSAHARRHGLARQSHERLSELGRQLPPPTPDVLADYATERRAVRKRHLAVGVIVTLVVLVVAAVVVQQLRPLPTAAFQPAASTSVRLPGTVPALPWPTEGAAAVAVEGVGSFGHVGSTQPQPIAGLADVLAAYVILHDHPLSATGGGPTIAVTPQTISAYRAGRAFQEAEVPVTAGESLSERQALEGMLVASGNDMAVLLADWDAGSTGAFVTKMNDEARILALRSTHIADPSGLDPRTVSTPLDLIRLGEAALRIPGFIQIVSLGETTLPNVPLSYNLNFDLGQDGIMGIMSATSAAAQGCYLFAAAQVVDGRSVTVVGAVLGQTGASANTAAVEAGDGLDKAVLASIGVFPVFSPGQVVGTLVTPWGARSPLTATTSMSVLGWPGLTVSFSGHLDGLYPPVRSDAPVGRLGLRQAGQPDGITMRTSRAIPGPSTLWRLTRTH